MKRETETKTPTSTAFDPLVAFKPLTPAAWVGTAWFENLADLGSEITSFVAERIREDVKTQHALLHCKSLTEVQKIQAEFIQKAFDQYYAETGNLVDLSSKLAEKMVPKSGK